MILPPVPSTFQSFPFSIVLFHKLPWEDFPKSDCAPSLTHLIVKDSVLALLPLFPIIIYEENKKGIPTLKRAGEYFIHNLHIMD